jgi:DNA-binding transcriptional regulator GbsR (MarR family)
MPPEMAQELRARIPAHVVHREFPEETVVLNLETGQYHGLNATAGRMLAALVEADSIGLAASALEREFGVSRARIERDLVELCDALAARGLVEFDDVRPV